MLTWHGAKPRTPDILDSFDNFLWCRICNGCKHLQKRIRMWLEIKRSTIKWSKINWSPVRWSFYIYYIIYILYIDIYIYKSPWPFHSTQLRVASFGLEHLKNHGSLRLAAISSTRLQPGDPKLQVLHKLRQLRPRATSGFSGFLSGCQTRSKSCEKLTKGRTSE